MNFSPTWPPVSESLPSSMLSPRTKPCMLQAQFRRGSISRFLLSFRKLGKIICCIITPL
ncbi:unnamed protein product, partial [Linum tenue]